MAKAAWPHPGSTGRTRRHLAGGRRRLEAADGGVSIENLLRILRALGIQDLLTEALDPLASDVGRLRSEEELPRRVRPRRLTDDG